MNEPEQNEISNHAEGEEISIIDDKLYMLAESDETATNEKLDMLISEVHKIREEQCDMIKSIDSCHVTLSVVTKELKTQGNILDLCFGDVDYLRNECSYVRDTIDETNVSLNDCQQYMRRNIVEIHGVPEINNEDIIQTVIKVMNAFGFELKVSMFYAAHRLPKNPFKPNDPRKISFKFIRHSDKENLIKKKKLKKLLNAAELGFQSNREIYLTDSLTAENRKLLALMKEMKSEKGIRYVWTSDGKVLVRRVEGGPVKVIRCREDIDLL